MKTFTKNPPRLIILFIFSLFYWFFSTGLKAQDNCEISKSHGEGYTTSIASVTENDNGTHTIVLIVEYSGCFTNTCKKMNHYSVEADPGTYSGIQVQTLSGAFTYASINYGPNIGGVPFQGFRINNTNGMGNGGPASFSLTYTLTGLLQDQQVLIQTNNVDLPASFTANEFQTVLECQAPDILPYYTPPEGGKSYDLIGAELTSLYYAYLNSGSYISDDIFQIVGSSVLIDVLVNSGKYDSTLALLITPEYGLTSPTGDPDQLIITGLFPILNLLLLNELPGLINYARPIYTALGNSGLVNSQGDISMRTYLSRTAFDLTGQGIKIGVLSDSYNTQLGDQASDDVLRGDLPGVTNPDNTIPVDVVKDFPYGTLSDEGRAMLQILHDVAPGAELAFRTGFLGPADFAQGILELKEAGCDIIVDDITYISEPFFRDGIVAQAVDNVTSQGVTYFSAAGNFGSKAYQSNFYPVTAPEGILGEAHNFAGSMGGTDIYQSISLTAGNYTVVMQWDDGTPGKLTNSDFDIYLSNDNGSTLFGFNRVNLGGAPLEVLPFTVVADSAQTNFIIIRSSGTGSASLKYIIFRGDIQINEYATPGASTLVGQANAEGAIAVGAVLFSNTPEYGINPPTVASFSSRGGTPVDGTDRYKPEITAPNGVNTTVNLGGFDIDGDEFPNFFGTSAAAPHAAGVAALILEARQKYYSEGISPNALKNLLQSTAIDMNTPGYDPASGAGFINADGSLSSLANPAPYITGIYYDTTLIPGVDPVEITIFGQYLTDQAVIFFNGDTLENATIILGDTAVSSTIAPFDVRYPLIQVYNPPMEGTNGSDGGFSNPLYFTTKETIVVDIDNKSKKYGEVLPQFTAEYYVETVNGTMSLDSAGLSQVEIDRIQSIAFSTVADALSNTGLWAIEADDNDPLNPQSDLETTDSLDISLLERFIIDVENGLLTIDKVDLVISPKDTTFTYGDVIGGFDYNFSFNNDTLNQDFGFEISDADSLAILSSFSAKYATALVNETALVNAKTFITATALVNKSMMISNATFNQFATALVNGTFISPPSFQTATALVNTVTFTGSSALAPATALVNGEVIVNGFTAGYATALVNAANFISSFGGATALVNANTVNGQNNSDAIVILGGGDINILNGDSIGEVDLRGINLITGNTVGQHFIVPGSFVSNNFEISYLPGILTIVPDTAIVQIDPVSLTQTYDATAKSVSVTTIPEGLAVLVTYDSIPGGPVNSGSYIVHAVIADSNYVGAATGTLAINPATATVTADLKWIYDYDPLPEFTANFSGFLGSDDESVVDSLSFTVSPTYTGAAGTYQIIPYASATNYVFTAFNGLLYVNPNGAGTKQIKPRLVCVEQLAEPDSSGFLYIANYKYFNDNSTDVYIPAGTDNYFSGQASYNAINQPELFVAGGGEFSVPFDGSKLIWTVKSYKTNGQKGAVASAASSSSSRCNKSEEAEAPVISFEESGDVKAFPNPTSGKVTIELIMEMLSVDGIRVYDCYGKALPVKMINPADKQVEIDLTGYASGIYFIRINDGESITVTRVIKK